MRRLFRPNRHGQTFDQFDLTARTTHLLCNSVSWNESTLVREDGSTTYERDRAHTVRMGMVNRIRNEEGRLATLCDDCRNLNALTVKEAYKTPQMDECLDSLGRARTFSKLDTNLRYW